MTYPELAAALADAQVRMDAGRLTVALPPYEEGA